MPKLSPTMESGVITQWMVKVGDQVKEGDVLADIETDKATMPMQAFDDGIVAILDHAVGDEVKLGDRVLVLAKKGEDPKQVAEQFGGGKKAATPEPAQAGPISEEVTNTPHHPEVSNGQEAAEIEVTRGEGERVKSSPLARKI